MHAAVCVWFFGLSVHRHDAILCNRSSMCFGLAWHTDVISTATVQFIRRSRLPVIHDIAPPLVLALHYVAVLGQVQLLPCHQPQSVSADYGTQFSQEAPCLVAHRRTSWVPRSGPVKVIARRGDLATERCFFVLSVGRGRRRC
jgi:hypothetical protein